MSFIIVMLSITAVQIPGLVLRYLPYANMLSREKKSKLLMYYALVLALQILAVTWFTKGNMDTITPLTYKRMLFILSTLYVFVNIAIIKGSTYKHIFIYGMQGGYSLFIHSIVALAVNHFSAHMTLPMEFGAQTTGYIFLFVLLFLPFWKKLKNSIIFNSAITDTYYWNIIWMIPALAIYSDAMITMNHEWINSFPQVLSRIMTALSLIISWRWITLDFQSLENMLYLKNVNRVLHLQTEGILAQAHLLSESEKSLKIYKHDMRHHLGIIGSLIQKKEIPSALGYIEELDSRMKTELPALYCKNIVINSVIHIYMVRAKEKNIPVYLKLNIPENLPWNANDLAILIANAFENAIIASEKQPLEEQKIEVSAHFENDQLALTINNKYDGDITFGRNGFPIAHQSDHGIGIQSILSVVSKYDAHASCTHKDGWFKMNFLFTGLPLG